MTINLLDPRLPDRFWNKVQPCPMSGCWIWTGYTDRRGYGTYTCEGKTRFAHRVAFAVLRVDPPRGLELDHLCRVTSCCNPEHLEAVTHLVNVARSRLRAANTLRHKDRTHCLYGHRYTEHGGRRKNGRRFCRACDNERHRDRYRAMIASEVQP